MPQGRGPGQGRASSATCSEHVLPAPDGTDGTSGKRQIDISQGSWLGLHWIRRYVGSGDSRRSNHLVVDRWRNLNRIPWICLVAVWPAFDRGSIAPRLAGTIHEHRREQKFGTSCKEMRWYDRQAARNHCAQSLGVNRRLARAVRVHHRPAARTARHAAKRKVRPTGSLSAAAFPTPSSEATAAGPRSP